MPSLLTKNELKGAALMLPRGARARVAKATQPYDTTGGEEQRKGRKREEGKEEERNGKIICLSFSHR